VNWFRKDSDGRYLWPGFGENSRVLEWILRRVEGAADATPSPVGLLPTPGSLPVDGLDVPAADLHQLLAVDRDAWLAECHATAEWFTTFGSRLPTEMVDRLDDLRERLAAS
jgi:phosphoenolpyruvate carboxykinase (GTP)